MGPIRRHRPRAKHCQHAVLDLDLPAMFTAKPIDRQHKNNRNFNAIRAVA